MKFNLKAKFTFSTSILSIDKEIKNILKEINNASGLAIAFNANQYVTGITVSGTSQVYVTPGDGM